MGKRVAYGALAIVVLFILVDLDVLVAERAEAVDDPLGKLLRRGNVLPAFLLVIVLRGAAELTRLLRSKGARPHALFASLMISVLLLTPWLSAAGWLGQGPAELEGFYWQVVWLSVTAVGVCVLSVLRCRPDDALRDVGATLTIVLYLGFLSSFALQLRSGRDVPGQDGAWLLLITVLVTKASDIGAYFGGSTLGRHKLAPLISPGKSVEGAAAGLIASAGVAVLFASATPLVTGLSLDHQFCQKVDAITRSFSLEHVPGALPPVWRAALFGIAMSAAGQFGDLVESCFKRDAGIKDSGNIMPHYGGVLDMIDSPVLAMPVAWFLLTVVWNVV
jgi:phosphatidate cytidylyltransferase